MLVALFRSLGARSNDTGFETNPEIHFYVALAAPNEVLLFGLTTAFQFRLLRLGSR
jgi:hypothetical protein